MKLKHTQKKSANRSISKEIFSRALVGIMGKHGRRLFKYGSNTTAPKTKRRKRESKLLRKD